MYIININLHLWVFTCLVICRRLRDSVTKRRKEKWESKQKASAFVYYIVDLCNEVRKFPLGVAWRFRAKLSVKSYPVVVEYPESVVQRRELQYIGKTKDPLFARYRHYPLRLPHPCSSLSLSLRPLSSSRSFAFCLGHTCPFSSPSDSFLKSVPSYSAVKARSTTKRTRLERSFRTYQPERSYFVRISSMANISGNSRTRLD